MHRIVLTAMLLAPTALLPAQVDAGGTKSKSAKAAYQMLTEEYSQAQTESRRLASIAREAGERVQLGQAAVAFVPRFQQAAKDYAGTEDAVQFLTWITLNAGSDADATNAAVNTLVADHIASEAWTTLALRLAGLSRTLGDERVAETMASVLARTPHDAVKAEIFWARGNKVIRDAYGKPAPEDKRLEAIADLRKVRELIPSGDRAEAAKRGLFELENLQNGMPAPEIVGPDIDGVEFKLSDYRGKVVVLDFWGDW